MVVIPNVVRDLLLKSRFLVARLLEMTEKPEQLLAQLMEDYRRAWEGRNADLVVSLFTEDATYHENPFGEPVVGRAGIRRYWEQAVGSQRDIRFRWHPLSSPGNLPVVEWEAEFTRMDSGRPVHLRGVMVLELCGERIFRFREYWLRRENSQWDLRREDHAGWGC